MDWIDRAIDRNDWIYFIASHDRKRIKIGRAHRLESRLKSYVTLSPYDIILLGFVPHESPWYDSDGYNEVRLHRRWARLRLHGEWFDASGELISWIESVAVSVNKEISVVIRDIAERREIISEKKRRRQVANKKYRDRAVEPPSEEEQQAAVAVMERILSGRDGDEETAEGDAD